MRNIVLVVDAFSRKVCEIDSSILNENSISVVTDLNEIRENMLSEEREVILLEGYSKTVGCIGNLVLNKKYGNYSYIFAGSKNFTETFNSFGRCCVCDTSFITVSLIQSIIFDDAKIYSNTSPFEPEDFSALLKKTTDPEVLKLLNAYENVCAQRDDLSMELKKINQIVTTKDNLTISLKEENKRWKNGFNDLVTDIREYVKTIEQYESILQKDVYTKISLRDYPKAPALVYLKVFPGFTGLNPLLQTLFNVYKVQKGKSVKVLRLFDSTGVQKFRLLPDYYTKLRSRYTIADIIKNDYIAKTGDYRNLVETLLINKYSLDVLIIVDEKDFDDVIIRAPHVCLCNSQRDATIFGCLPSFTVLSTPSEGWNTWDSKSDGLDNREKFIKFSTQSGVTSIIKFFKDLDGNVIFNE